MNVIVVNGTQARTFDGVEPFVTGQSNFDKVGFRFDNTWDGMTKIAQFVQGSNRYNVAVENNECICPSELVEGCVFVRVRGYSATDVIATANEIQIPVEQGFESGGVPPVPPTPDLYQKLLKTVQDQIGDLGALKTEDKSSLVAAVNEIWMSGGGGASVTDASIDESGHLIITLSTGKTIDAGYAVGPAGATGSVGKDGKDGIGIQSVEQTTISTEDSGINIVTVTKTDGEISTFSVRNGSRGSTGPAGADGKNGQDGSQGPAGADGKTAYQYAQEGGYAGTEAEFAEKLAAEIPEAYNLPIASSTVLGGVKPVSKTDAMTQSVGVDEAGALWTVPVSGGGGGLPSVGTPYQQLVTDGVGNTKWEDRLAYDDSKVVDAGHGFQLVKVADEVPSWASVDSSMKVWMSDGTNTTVTPENNVSLGNGSFMANGSIFIIATDNSELENDGNTVVFPEKGVYFASIPENYVTGIASADSDTPEITWDGNIVGIKKLDEKFLPEPLILYVHQSGSEA